MVRRINDTEEGPSKGFDILKDREPKPFYSGPYEGVEKAIVDHVKSFDLDVFETDQKHLLVDIQRAKTSIAKNTRRAMGNRVWAHHETNLMSSGSSHKEMTVPEFLSYLDPSTSFMQTDALPVGEFLVGYVGSAWPDTTISGFREDETCYLYSNAEYVKDYYRIVRIND